MLALIHRWKWRTRYSAGANLRIGAIQLGPEFVGKLPLAYPSFINQTLEGLEFFPIELSAGADWISWSVLMVRMLAGLPVGFPVLRCFPGTSFATSSTRPGTLRFSARPS